jgi:hypothetical protein
MAEYIITDEMETIVAATQAALDIPVLNYLYGYVEELNETLNQWENDPLKFELKFPLVWLSEPFDVAKGNDYGQTELTLYIINNTQADWKSSERMENNFKPVLIPIYQELLNQLAVSNVFTEMNADTIKHKATNRYYFGEGQKSVLNDVVDCLKISQLKLSITNKLDCSPFTNF